MILNCDFKSSVWFLILILNHFVLMISILKSFCTWFMILNYQNLPANHQILPKIRFLLQSLTQHISWNGSSKELRERIYTAIFEKNMINSALNYLIPDWSTAVTWPWTAAAATPGWTLTLGLTLGPGALTLTLGLTLTLTLTLGPA